MINDNLILNCTAVGSPKPKIQWLVNGTSRLGMENIFSTADSSTQVTSFLNITMSAVTHTGTYSCLATNSFYSNHSLESSSATVTVHLPDISVIPTITETVGVPLILECNVTSLNGITNSVEIVWSSDGIELTGVVNITSITSNTTLYTGYYTIPLLSTTDHNRVYQCSVIINESPLPMTRTTTVNVNVPSPMVIIPPSRRDYLINASQSIECVVYTVSGVDPSSVIFSWMRQDRVMIVNNSRVTIDQTDSSGNTHTSILRFAQIKEMDNGVYNCNVAILESNASNSTEIIVQEVEVICQEDKDDAYQYIWPATKGGESQFIYEPCFKGNVSRFCDSDGQWLNPDASKCYSIEYHDIQNAADDLTRMLEDPNNTNQSDIIVGTAAMLIVNLTVVMSRDPNSPLLPNDISTALNALDITLQAGERYTELFDTPGLADSYVDVFDTLLSPVNSKSWMQSQQSGVADSSSLLMTTGTFGNLLAENLNDTNAVTKVRDNLVITVKSVDPANVNDILFPLEEEVNSIDANFTDDSSASILIPAMVVKDRGNKDTNNVPVSGILFTTLQNILPISNSSKQNITYRAATSVISSQVTDTSGAVAEPVSLSFNISQQQLYNPVCGFWNFSINNGRGGWDTTGVDVIELNDQVIRCNSSHLTSFAVLVDVDGSEPVGQNSPEKRALSIVSYIGCTISLICLLISIALLLIFRTSLLKGIHNFVHLNLAIALSLALTTFIAGIETAVDNEAACAAVAVLLHLFFTAAFTWMLCEGIMLYIKLVKVIYSGIFTKWWLYMIIGWGTPIPIVAMSAGIFHEDYGTYHHCWIEASTDSFAIWVFVVTLLIIVAINTTILYLALRAVYRNHRHKKLHASPSTAKNGTLAQNSVARKLLLATVILLPLLGLTWVFGLLAVNHETSVFSWIFTILNSLQGFCILYFHILRSEKVWGYISGCFKRKMIQPKMRVTVNTSAMMEPKQTYIINTITNQASGAASRVSRSNSMTESATDVPTSL
ncbi:adhesion G protein-coupled receptor L3-like isoform X2 [Dysidea avara]